MDTIRKLSDYALETGSPIRFIGVPKTIDNDLDVTDHTPGFGSAAKYIGAITKEVIRDGLVFDQNMVTIIEIMGRNAGWLTGASALAKCEDCEGPDLIYLPEIPFSVESFIDKVSELHKVKKSIIVAISEGIRTPQGKYISELTDTVEFVDAFGHKALSGSAKSSRTRLVQNSDGRPGPSNSTPSSAAHPISSPGSISRKPTRSEAPRSKPHSKASPARWSS